MTFGDSGMILHFVTVIVTEIYTQVRHTKLYMMSQDFKSSSFLFSIFTYYFKFSYKYTMYLGHIYPHSFLSTSLRLPLTHIPPNFMSSLYLCNSLSPSSVVHMHTDVGSYTQEYANKEKLHAFTQQSSTGNISLLMYINIKTNFYLT